MLRLPESETAMKSQISGFSWPPVLGARSLATLQPRPHGMQNPKLHEEARTGGSFSSRRRQHDRHGQHHLTIPATISIHIVSVSPAVEDEEVFPCRSGTRHPHLLLLLLPPQLQLIVALLLPL